MFAPETAHDSDANAAMVFSSMTRGFQGKKSPLARFRRSVWPSARRGADATRLRLPRQADSPISPRDRRPARTQSAPAEQRIAPGQRSVHERREPEFREPLPKVNSPSSCARATAQHCG